MDIHEGGEKVNSWKGGTDGSDLNAGGAERAMTNDEVSWLLSRRYLYGAD